MCCSSGKVQLPELKEVPETLANFMQGETSISKEFLKNIRKYNCCFQMTSFGTTQKVDYSTFPYTFKIQGQIYHTFGSLLPIENENHEFLQLYFIEDM